MNIFHFLNITLECITHQLAHHIPWAQQAQQVPWVPQVLMALGRPGPLVVPVCPGLQLPPEPLGNPQHQRDQSLLSHLVVNRSHVLLNIYS